MIHKIQRLAHSKGMLIAYLPKEKIVIEADLFTSPNTLVANPKAA